MTCIREKNEAIKGSFRRKMQHFQKMQNYFLQCALQGKNMTWIIGLVTHIYNYNGRELILRESSLSLILQNENIFRNLSSTNFIISKVFPVGLIKTDTYESFSKVFTTSFYIKLFHQSPSSAKGVLWV